MIPASETVVLDLSYLHSWTTTPVMLRPAPDADLGQLVPVAVMIQTDGTPEAIDRARTVLALSIGLGFLAAWLMVIGIDDSYQVAWPSTDYFIALGVSLTFALAAVIATFGLIHRNTTPTSTRFA